MRNVLVVQLHRLGDVLQSTPALQALRRSQPDASISVLARSCFAEPLRGNPSVDELIEWDADAVIADSRDEDIPLSAQHAEIMQFADRLQRSRFDLAINLSNDMLSSMLVFLSGARETRGLTFLPSGGIQMPDPWTRYLFLVPTNRALNTINICDAFRGLAGAAHVPGAMSLPFSQADRAAAGQILASANAGGAPLLVAMQPGASSASKRWPVERFAALANALARRHGARIVVVGSGAETPLAQRLAALMDTPPVVASGRTSLRQLAALLERCALLVSNDTATIHAAAAVGTPAIVLSFGYTYSRETAPYGEGHFVVEPSTACFPCVFDGPCSTLDCLNDLTPDAILAACEIALGRVCASHAAGRLDTVSLWRTEFDACGLLRLEAVNPQPLRAEHIIREAYRHYWTAKLLPGAPPSTASREFSDTAPWHDSLSNDMESAIHEFRALRALAAPCVKAAALLGAALAHPDAAESAQKAAAALDRLCARIVEGEASPAVRPLVTAFAHRVALISRKPLAEQVPVWRLAGQELLEASGLIDDALTAISGRLAAPHAMEIPA